MDTGGLFFIYIVRGLTQFGQVQELPLRGIGRALVGVAFMAARP